MPKTFSQVLVERSAPMVADRLWSGSCPLRRPLFRELPPSTQALWARSAQQQGHPNALSLSDDPGLRGRAAIAVTEKWEGIEFDFAAEDRQNNEDGARYALFLKQQEEAAAKEADEQQSAQ